MPRYDYVCQRCGRVVEVTHGVHSSGPSRCEHCGGEMRKMMSAPAIVFKGSGWAKKDRSSRPPSKTKTTDSESRSGTDNEAKSPAASDAQPSKPSAGNASSDSDA